MAYIIPYINFADKGREQLEFYKGVFGGEYEIMLVKDSPMGSEMNPVWGERIMHAEFTSDKIRFYGSDIISDQAGLERGNGYNLALMCDSTEQLKDFYARLIDGGNEVFAPSDSEWGSVFGQCVDRYGVSWMLESPKQ